MDYVPVCVAIIVDAQQNILLTKRGKAPFLGAWSLVGGVGYAKKDLGVEDGITHEVVGDVAAHPRRVTELFRLTEANRDVVVFEVVVAREDTRAQLPHVTELRWIDLAGIEQESNLAFRHQDILRIYAERYCN